MADIRSITECAAAFYHDGEMFRSAVWKALDQYDVQNPSERVEVFKEVCRALSERGRQKKKALKEKVKAVGPQMSLRLPPG